jgi:hypothetical protein
MRTRPRLRVRNELSGEEAEAGWGEKWKGIRRRGRGDGERRRLVKLQLPPPDEGCWVLGLLLARAAGYCCVLLALSLLLLLAWWLWLLFAV